MEDAAPWALLARHLAGEASAEDTAEVERWVAGAPGRGPLLEALGRTVARLEAGPAADVDVDAALRRAHARLDAADVHALDTARERRPAGGRMRVLRAAAVVALLLVAGLVWRGSMGGGDNVPAESIAATSWTTPAGRTEAIRLPDGTAVLLGPLSRLTLGAGYGAETRTVELTGEALFDVVHREDSRFLVRAGGGLVEDLGTTFTVRSIDSDEVRVAVTAGTVRLQAAGGAGEGVVLEAGDRGLLRGSVATAQPAAGIDSDIAWTEGRLVFEEAPFERVRTELRRWYDIELRVDDPALSTPPLTTSFEDASREEVLDLLALVYGVTIEQRGDTAILHATTIR